MLDALCARGIIFSVQRINLIGNFWCAAAGNFYCALRDGVYHRG